MPWQPFAKAADVGPRSCFHILTLWGNPRHIRHPAATADALPAQLSPCAPAGPLYGPVRARHAHLLLPSCSPTRTAPQGDNAAVPIR